MISDAQLAPLLRAAGEGEIILAGALLPGLSDEQIAWVVMENVKDKRGRHRLTLHAYYHDVFVVSKVVTVAPEADKLTWGATGVKT